MGYAERVLQPGETIGYRGKLHWMLMAPGIALTVISGSLSIVAAVKAIAELRMGLLGVSLVLFLIGRNSIEMNLDKVESVMVNQGILGRILDYGTIIIRGVGSGLEPIANVAAPLEFHRQVNGGS